MLWLQARGLDALTPLGAALSALEQATPRPLELGRRESCVDVLDAGGQPAVSVASDAIDFAIARALEREARTEVLLTGIEGGMVVAGALAQRPRTGLPARVEWGDGDTRMRLEVASNGECRLCSTPANATDSCHGLGPNAARIAIDGPGRGPWTDRGTPWRIDTDEAEFARRAIHSVTHGIDVPDALWTRLVAFAKRTLVPANHASRERGAGGGEYND